MSSKAREAFAENSKDVERLLEIHSQLAGDTPGRKRGVEVLNKSAVVLTCAVWEAYCEDIAAEAVEHLIEHAPHASALPKALCKSVAKELKDNIDDSAIWKLAGDGWREYLRSRTKTMTDIRNRNLNTPKTKNIGKLFEDTIGLTKVPTSWFWPGMSASQAAKKLDKFVTLRGDIAHRAHAAENVKKSVAWKFADHASRLVGETDGYINHELGAACGRELF